MRRIGLILVDHGSKRPEANAALEEMARRLAARRPDLLVGAAHMEIAAPFLDEEAARLIARGAEELVVHPFMLAPGRHASQDIPAQVEALRSLHPTVHFRTTEPLGPHDALVDIVLERAALVAGETGGAGTFIGGGPNPSRNHPLRE